MYGVGVGVKFDIIFVIFVKVDYYYVKGDSSFVFFINFGVVVIGISIE